MRYTYYHPSSCPCLRCAQHGRVKTLNGATCVQLLRAALKDNSKYFVQLELVGQ
jgi:hypothetical protein